jgi:hypothetical protein
MSRTPSPRRPRLLSPRCDRFRPGAADARSIAAGPFSPGALHRHRVGALTSRAAFPVTASTSAIACQRRRPPPPQRFRIGQPATATCPLVECSGHAIARATMFEFHRVGNSRAAVSCLCTAFTPSSGVALTLVVLSEDRPGTAGHAPLMSGQWDRLGLSVTPVLGFVGRVLRDAGRARSMPCDRLNGAAVRTPEGRLRASWAAVVLEADPAMGGAPGSLYEGRA